MLMMYLGYAISAVTVFLLGIAMCLTIWLWLSRSFVWYYVILKADKKFPDNAVKPEFKSKFLWRIRLFLLVFSSTNFSTKCTYYSRTYTIHYKDYGVRYTIHGECDDR